MSRRQSPGIDEESKTRSEKRSPRIRHQASSCAEGREINSEDSSLLGVATVIHGQGEGCDSACSENDRGGDKSKSDDSAVLQALYDGAPLSSVFHHDIAEGASWLRLVSSMHVCTQLNASEYETKFPEIVHGSEDS